MANQIVVSAGAKVRNLDGVLTGTSGVVNSLPINASNGIPQLDVNGKILVSQLPNSVMEYLGTWNAATNSPTLTNGGAFNQGDVYLCNVAGTTNFGAGPISFIVGDQAIYSGTIWQKAGGATGTVTSVAITESGDSLNITGSPITTSGTINIGFNGTNLQYVNGAGNLTTFPTLITSIGLSMPSAFSVANSPLTANGTIAVTGAGYASQYIRGDGTLADFPSSGGGGSSVSYYLNGGTSQGTIGGVTYYEMSKTADTGTGVDFAKSGDGFIVAFLTDANDPAQLNIPAGNWNYEIYASMSANGGTPQMYAELYKYDGTTFTLISTSSNEILYDGTNLNLYTFGMTVPATTLALTDRLAIKLYATNSGGKTTTIHTQDSHLCQVITTFSTGITALNGLTAQVQYFQTGTSGTDFNITSTTATHTFNIPDASATARGLITTGTQTIAGIKTFSSGINVDYIGVTGDISMDGSFSLKQVAYGTLQSGYTNLSGQTNGLRVGLFGGYNALLNFSTSGSYTYTFPSATGTIALTSDIPSLAGYVTLGTTQTITGAKTFSAYTTFTSTVDITSGLTFSNSGFTLVLQPPTLSVNRTVTLPNGTGTLALTSDIPSITGLVPYTGATGDVNLGLYSLTSNAIKVIGDNSTYGGTLSIKQSNVTSLIGVGYTELFGKTNRLGISFGAGSVALLSNSTLTAERTYTLPDATGTIALVGGSGVGTVTSVAATGGTGISITGSPITTSGTITITNTAPDQTVALTASTGISVTGTYPNFTITNTSPSSGGTVTSVAALTIGTSGTDLSSSVANSTTTPVITLNVPTASAANRGALSSADWTTFNNKQSALTNPVTGTGTTNYLPKFTGTSTIGNSVISESSGTISITNSSILTSAMANPQLRLINNATATINQRIDLGLRWEDGTYNGIGGISMVRESATARSGKLILSGINSSGDPNEAVTITSTGNLGLGVTPSAWRNLFTALQVGYTGALYSTTVSTAGEQVNLASNYYQDSAGNELRIQAGYATRYQQASGEHRWSTAGTSTAGSGITFTQAMTLTAAGNLVVGGTTAGTSLNTSLTVNNPSAGNYSGLIAMTADVQRGYYGGTSTGLEIGVSGSGLLDIYTNGSPRIRATSGGNILIGTTTDSVYKLDVNGTGRFSGDVTIKNTSTSANLFIDAAATGGSEAGLYFKNGGTNKWENYTANNDTALNWYSYANSTVVFKLASTGAATFSSSVTATSFFESSDSRLKTLIQDNYQTKGIASITPKLYTKNGKVELGYYAQDFVGILDSAVSKGSDDMLSLSYREVLVAKVYALEQRIKELENK